MKMRVPVLLMFFVISLMVAGGISVSSYDGDVMLGVGDELSTNYDHYDDSVDYEVYGDLMNADYFYTDPAGFVEGEGKPSSNSFALDGDDLAIVGRMAEGVARWKIREGAWCECGIVHVDPAVISEKAMKYAFVVVKAAKDAAGNVGDKNWFLNPWGLAGTMMKESQWDRCAIGPYPRKKAYELGLMKRPKRCLSHKEEDVLRAIKHSDMRRNFGRTGYDLGTAQLLSRFYDDRNDYENMLSFVGSTREAAFEMKHRGIRFRTDRPWAYWPGHRSPRYERDVVRWARRIGAKPGEI